MCNDLTSNVVLYCRKTKKGVKDTATQFLSRLSWICLGKVVSKNVIYLQRISLWRFLPFCTFYARSYTVFLMFSFFLLEQKPLQNLLLGSKLLITWNHLWFCLCCDFFFKMKLNSFSFLFCRPTSKLLKLFHLDL